MCSRSKVYPDSFTDPGFHRNKGVLDSIVPAFGPTASPNTPWDWNYTTTPQMVSTLVCFSWLLTDHS